MKNKNINWNVVGLLSEHTLKPTLFVCLAIVIIQGIYIFTLGLQQATTPLALSEWLDGVAIRFSFIAAFIFIGWMGKGMLTRNSQVSYTIDRLGISKRQLFIVGSLNTAMMLVIFYGVQVAILLGISYYYQIITPSEYLFEQTVFLAAFRSSFFVTVLPLTNWVMISINVLSIVCISMLTGVSLLNLSDKNDKKGFGEFNGVALFVVYMFTIEHWRNVFTFLVLLIVCFLEFRKGFNDENKME